MSKFKIGDHVHVVFYSGHEDDARVLDLYDGGSTRHGRDKGPYGEPSGTIVHVELDSNGHRVSFYEDYVRLVIPQTQLAAEEYEEIILAQELMACSK